MKVVINNYGDLDESGGYYAILTGSYHYEDSFWIWRAQKGGDVMLNEEQHNEMLRKYWQWRKDNKIGWTNQTEQLYGKYTS